MLVSDILTGRLSDGRKFGICGYCNSFLYNTIEDILNISKFEVDTDRLILYDL